MTTLQKPSKSLRITLWIMQILLALFLISGAVLKFMPIVKVSALMPWTGQIPVWMVRALGIVDLLGAIGLIVPALVQVKSQLTSWAALGIVLLMISAIVFHVSRGETSVIGINLFALAMAVFIFWGRKDQSFQIKQK